MLNHICPEDRRWCCPYLRALVPAEGVNQLSSRAFGVWMAFDALD